MLGVWERGSCWIRGVREEVFVYVLEYLKSACVCVSVFGDGGYMLVFDVGVFEERFTLV